MPVTQRFSEYAALLGVINPASHSTEQNTGYVSLANYARAVVVIHCGVIGADLDVDFEEATDTTGGTNQSLDLGSKDVVIPNADDDTVYVFEIRTDELAVNSGFCCLNVEATPGGASIFGVQIWGLEPRYKPVATTLIDTITD